MGSLTRPILQCVIDVRRSFRRGRHLSQRIWVFVFHLCVPFVSWLAGYALGYVRGLLGFSSWKEGYFFLIEIDRGFHGRVRISNKGYWSSKLYRSVPPPNKAPR